MADDKHYVGGDYYQLDDLSGFKIRARRSRVIPGGQTGRLVVAPERFELQQPQDFVRGIPDIQTVDQPRPRQQNQFTYLATNVTTGSQRGDSAIDVETVVGFAAGMRIRIMLDSGVNWDTGIASIDGLTFNLVAPLPYSVGLLYGDPPENMVLFVAASEDLFLVGGGPVLLLGGGSLLLANG